MKFLRLLFSKWSIGILLLLAQVAAILLIVLLLNQYFIVFQVISAILGIIVFFACVNRRENPEYKIPWIFLILLLPIFGTLSYLIFSRHRVSKKTRHLYEQAVEELLPHVKANEDDEHVNAYMGEYEGLARYLKQNSGFGGQLGNEVKYYPVGEKMWVDMLAALESAKKFILMEYFIVDPGHMWDSIHEILVRKAKEGVKVHFVYDDVGTMTMLKSGYYKTLRKEGIDAYKFNPFTPIVSSVYNNRSHRKITVVDGEVAFTGGINLGDEYINENDRLGHWKDTGIRMKGSAVNTWTSLFFLDFIAAKHGVPENIGSYYETSPVKYEEEGAIVPFGDGPRPLYDEQVGEENFINILGKAKKYFYITTPYLIIDHHLTQALKNAAQRGVDVRIITPHIPDKKAVFCMTRSSYAELREAGVKIYEYTPGFIHAKMLICDDVVAFVGTINMDYRSLTHHYECGALLYKNPCLEDIKADFEHIFEVSEYIDDNFKLSRGAKLINAVLAVFRALF